MAGETPKVVIGAEAPYFCHSATLRIWGDIADLDGISRRLGLAPTHAHRKGEKRGPRSPRYQHDHWSYTAPVEESRSLEEHLLALWVAVRPHIAYLKSLKRTLNVDVFCGYRSNSQTAGFQVGHECLELFVKLEVPFGVSVIVLPDGDGGDGDRPLDCIASRIESERSAGRDSAREGPALFRAVCEQPGDDGVRLVYADWLEEHGQHQRAEFIRFQCQTQRWDSSHPDFPQLLERVEEFDRLTPLWEKELPVPPSVKWRSGWFERGFIASVTFQSARAFREHAEAVFAASPVDSVEVGRVTDRTIGDVVASPLLSRLRRLLLRGTLSDEGVRLVAACPGLTRLESLGVWGGGFGDAAAEAIARSPHLASLKCLSFSTHSIGDRGALALAESPNLGGVTALVLHGTRGLSRQVVKRLKRRFQRLD